VVAGAGDIAATDLSEGAAADVLADWLSPWSAEAPATGFTDGIAPVTTTGEAASAGLSDETAAAAAGGRSTDAGGLRSSEFKAFELHLACVLKALLTLRRVVGGSRAVRFRDAYQLEAGVQAATVLLVDCARTTVLARQSEVAIHGALIATSRYA
jgi:hypothetical protein